MKIEELIESGKLELYALGALDKADQLEIESLLAENDALRNEYHKIASALEEYGQAESVNPPASVLQKAKEEINKEESSQVIPMRPSSTESKTNYWAIAASILLLVSVGLNFKLNSNLKQSQSKYLALESQNQQIAATTVQLNKSNEELNQLIASIAQDGVERTIISATPSYEGMQSAVYWNEAKQEIILATQNLPALSAEEQYQLWAIVDGKPVDLGVFDSDDRLAKMKQVQGQVQAFAVTIEPKGGSIDPSLDKMCMLGNVSS